MENSEESNDEDRRPRRNLFSLVFDIELSNSIRNDSTSGKS